MALIRALFSSIFSGIGVEPVDNLDDAEPCDGLQDCVLHAVSKLASGDGSGTSYWTVLEQIRSDFVLSRVMFLLNISVVCIIFRSHIVKASKCFYSLGCNARRNIERLLSSEYVSQKAEEQIKDLRTLNLNVSKVAQTKLASLEQRLDIITRDKQFIKDDLSAFKDTVIENQKEHLELTKRWARHVDEMMDRSKSAEARRAASVKKSSGIPVLLNSPRRPSPKVTSGGQ